MPYCDCVALCGGNLRKISTRTARRHAPYLVSAAFEDALASHRNAAAEVADRSPSVSGDEEDVSDL